MPTARRLPTAIVWAAWTIPALLSTFETVMIMGTGGRPIETWRAFASEAPGWYMWALLTPLIARWAEWFPLGRPLQWRSVAAHIAGWLVVASAAAGTWAAASHWLRGAKGEYLITFSMWFLSGLPFTVLGYSAVVGICYMLANRELAHERERQSAELARQLTQAQLATLRAQLQPHFLFNSLNAIMALVRDADNKRAIDALTTLSAILRASLQLGEVSEIALSREVAFTRDYLDLELMRFPDRLRVTFDIPPALLDARVPTFVLQPFVENAIKHGLMDRRQGIAIQISARQFDDNIELSVRDDGAGFARVSRNPDGGEAATTESESVGGVGIANVRQRLRSMYGNSAVLSAGANETGDGALVKMRFPLSRLRAA